MVAAGFCSPTSSQPLPDFEKIVAKCKAAFTAPFSDVTQLPSTGQWIKRTTWPGGIEYDVRKTDSLVSPFVGHILVSTLVVGARAESEDAAKALELNQEGALTKRETRISFAYREGVWQAVDGSERTTMRLKAGDNYQSPLTMRQTKDELLRPTTASARCLTGE